MSVFKDFSVGACLQAIRAAIRPGRAHRPGAPLCDEDAARAAERAAPPYRHRYRLQAGSYRLMLWFATASVASAALTVTDLKTDYAIDPLGVDVAAPKLQWRVQSEERGERQTAWQVLVASSEEKLAKDTGDLWDSGKVVGDQTAQVRYAGKPLGSSQRAYWKVRSWDHVGEPTGWSEVATWLTGVMNPADWKATWIGAGEKSETLLLRREFVVKPGLRRAIAHVTGLGQYELFLNGTKAGTDVISPGWTNYRKTVLYDTRDITALLRPGPNAAGIALGNGMYHVVRIPGRFAKFVGSFGSQRAIAQIELDYADGTRELVLTDDGWRTHAGPITFSSIYGGEDFDARLVPPGWNVAGFNDRDWTAAKPTGDSLGPLRGHAFAAEPLAPIETRAPKVTRALSPGVVLYDFGQNASFMPRVRVSGPTGSVVKLTAGEVVKPDGTIERGTMGGAHRGSAWWQYIKATGGEETWFPQFYYVGSRYLYTELMPATEGGARPKIESVEQVIVHSVAEPLGEFATSNPLLNQVRDLVRWAQRSNMVSVLTDCPHREKLGWIEQYHLNGPSIRYEFDVTRIYAKGMNDMAEAQTEDGLVPNIAPEYTQFKGAFRGAAEWGAAFILVPWQHYLFTGDADLLRTHYDAMKRYFAYLETRAQDNILSDGLGDWYDYLLGTGKRANLTPSPITATAFFYEDARMLAKIATVLAQTEDAKRFAARAGEIRRAYVAKFYRPEDGLYGTASQASLAISLVMGLVEPAHRDQVLAALVKDVEERGYATAGDVGFRYLLLALMEAGRSDVIYQLINQDEKPGYGYQIKQGATALTESWHAATGASHNHFMLGQVIEWFYHDLLGIAHDEAAPGFKHVVLRPQPVGDLAWVEGSYKSIHGPINVRWEKQPAMFHYRVEIPANTTATLWLPAGPAAKITEGGRPMDQVKGAKFIRWDGDRVLFSLESGRYHFESTW